MIRIMGGIHRGRMLKTGRLAEVRPILARIRKSLFDILAPRLTGSAFLDLYAGYGVVGIEALSRGARFAVFADVSRNSLKIIDANLAALGLAARAKTVRCDATGDLTFLSFAAGGPFDIVFMGPPYKDADKNPLALVKPTLEAVSSSKILAPAGVVIAQHHKKEPSSAAGWKLIRNEKYGDSCLSFFKPEQ